MHSPLKYAILRRSCRAEVAAWTSYLSAPPQLLVLKLVKKCNCRSPPKHNRSKVRPDYTAQVSQPSEQEMVITRTVRGQRIPPVEAEAVTSSSTCWWSLLNVHVDLRAGRGFALLFGSWREQLDKMGISSDQNSFEGNKDT